ncbi:MAG: cysteine desulfurase family protein [Leptospirillum sp.]
MTEYKHHGATMTHLDGDSMTPLRPGVREVMAESLLSLANPDARYASARHYAESLESSRAEVAKMIGAEPSEIFFTSCASEANTWAILGADLGNTASFAKLVGGKTNHISAINAMAERARRDHLPFELLRIKSQGPIEMMSQENSPRTLASFTWADAEVGIISPVRTIGESIRNSGGVFHIDFVTAQKTERIKIRELPIDMMTISSASMGGPPGISALYVRKGIRIKPLIFGGSQENGRRGGLIPVFLAEGWKKAIQHWNEHVDDEREKIDSLTRDLFTWFKNTFPQGVIPAHDEPRIPGIINMLVPGIDGQAAVSKLDAKNIQTGTGSSCSSQSLKVSHVLRALEISALLGQGSVVVSLSWNTEPSDIRRFQEVFPSVVEELTTLSPKNLGHARRRA